MAEPILERLFPPGEPASAQDVLDELRPWEDAPQDRPRVLVNMVATADGRIELGGRSGSIGGEADHEMFHALRTIVDAVLVGTGTLRAERYGRVVRDPGRRARRAARGLAEDPLALLITRTGELPWDAPLFAAPEQTVVIAGEPGVVQVPDGLGATIDVIEVPGATPLAALRAVRERHGVRAVLCEGGPRLNSGLLADGVLDELFLTIAPSLGGGAGDALRVLWGDDLPEPRPMELRWILGHEGEVFLRYAL